MSLRGEMQYGAYRGSSRTVGAIQAENRGNVTSYIGNLHKEEEGWADIYYNYNGAYNGRNVVNYRCQGYGSRNSRFSSVGDKRMQEGLRRKAVCWNYGEEGHYKTECPHPPKENDGVSVQKPKGSSVEQKVNLAVAEDFEMEEAENEQEVLE